MYANAKPVAEVTMVTLVTIFFAIIGTIIGVLMIPWLIAIAGSFVGAMKITSGLAVIGAWMGFTKGMVNGVKVLAILTSALSSVCAYIGYLVSKSLFRFFKKKQ